jgi:hypothetical protein
MVSLPELTLALLFSPLCPSPSRAHSGAALAAPAPGAPPARAIADVGDGLLEGAGAFGSSVMRGFRGLVEKPVAGARRTGVQGAFRGAAAGLVGAVVAPVSGALGALSATAEGFDASFARGRGGELVLARRRLPRVVGGDGRLLPLVRDGSEREAAVEAVGQALLRASLLAAAAPGGAAGAAAHRSGVESYEEHFVLPRDGVALLTSRALLLVAAPGFAALDGAAEVGEPAPAEVPPGRLQWAVPWEDVLALELRWGAPGKYPDRVVVHRKGAAGGGGGAPAAHLLQCFPGTPQASQVKAVAGKVLQRHCQDAARADRRWADRHAARGALPPGHPPQLLPLTLPSLDFQLVWHTNPARPPAVAFWRPVPPPGAPPWPPRASLADSRLGVPRFLRCSSRCISPRALTSPPSLPPSLPPSPAAAGYCPAGDVATLGMEPPLHPVPCLRDDGALAGAQRAGAGAGAGAPPGRPPSAQSAGGAEGGAEGAGPPAAHPVEFSLIWRYTGQRSVTMWMPVAPPGYVALGAVVVGAPETPSPEDYLCARLDLTAPARVFDSPIWSYAPPARGAPGAGAGAPPPPGAADQHPDAWRVAVWPVDSRMGTVVVVRALSKPPPEVARRVLAVDGEARG